MSNLLGFIDHSRFMFKAGDELAIVTIMRDPDGTKYHVGLTGEFSHWDSFKEVLEQLHLPSDVCLLSNNILHTPKTCSWMACVNANVVHVYACHEATQDEITSYALRLNKGFTDATTERFKFSSMTGWKVTLT